MASIGAEVGVRTAHATGPGGQIGVHGLVDPPSYVGPLRDAGALSAGLLVELDPVAGWEARAVTASLGLDAAYYGTPGSCVIDGRPLRHGSGLLRPRTSSSAGLDELAATWLRRAADEQAAVGAFRRLAHELTQLQAPQRLVRWALRCAREEVGHAAMSLVIAVQHHGAPLALGTLPVPARPMRTRRGSLRQLAFEARVDGVDNEGRAAAQSEHAAERLRDPLLATVERHIAREERGHAAFAVEVVRWCAAELSVGC